jgi:protein-tyrosine-phosphatase
LLPADPARRGELQEDAALAWSGARSLLFVCLGNICRSPFAERLALTVLAPDRRATSAGHYPGPGRRTPPDAVAVARRFGVDLGPHRSRVLSSELLEQADAVFVCDQQNYRAIAATHPWAIERTHFLGALCPDGPLTIRDPFGSPAAAYETVYRQIADAIAAAQGGPPGWGNRA